MLIKEGLIMPFRRYQSLIESDKKGRKIGILKFSPYNFTINHDETITTSLNITGRYNFKKFLFYDENNFNIIPPLLRSSITITYTEFRDLLCYLNLPVFRSTKNRNILFFPNYDLHLRLLEIQGESRNYGIYTRRNIEWKWFKEGKLTDDEWKAKQEIEKFCENFEESPGYGIEPAQYVWYEITFKNKNTKKYIFLVCTREEYHLHYSNLKYLTKNNKYYVYNDVIKEHALIKLRDDFKLKSPRIDSQESPSRIEPQKSFREKYIKYKKKYLELKNKYLELKNKYLE
jgi:hypothetical protein